MNPFLERADIWPIFEKQYLSALRDEIKHKLNFGYYTAMDSLAVSHYSEWGEREVRGTDSPSPPKPFIPSEIVAPERPSMPRRVAVPTVEKIERLEFIRLICRDDQHTEVAIHIVNPKFKHLGTTRDQYLTHRRQLLTEKSVVVEIDLLRAGRRLPVSRFPEGDYTVLKATPSGHAELWPVWLRDRLPTITLLLRGDDFVTLDCQHAFQTAYDSGDFSDYIFSLQPQPPLNEQDQEWAQAVIRNGGTTI